MSYATLRLAANSIAHFFVDAVCAAVVFGPARNSLSPETLSIAILVYNTLAFSTQCVFGGLFDRLGVRLRYAGAVSCAWIGLAAILPLPAFLRVVLAALGNAAFHVAGGSETLVESSGKAGPLGVFVAPGAMGLTLGTLFPRLLPVFVSGLFFAAVWLAVISRVIARNPDPVGKQTPDGGSESSEDARSDASMTPSKTPPKADSPYVGRIAALLLLAVAVRAIGGSAVSFPWKTGAGLSILLTAFVVLGKGLGGILADRIETKRLSIATVLLATVFLTFGASSIPLSLIGQLALNVTMPVTLWLLYRAMPKSPGLAFGLAASALWPGTIAGRLIDLTGPPATALTTASFLFGLAAILLSVRCLARSGAKPDRR